jgi:hypothetical protein
MATYLKGIGDAINRVNEIIPSFDAKILNYLAQNSSGGVCWSETNRFALTNIDRGVQIGAGVAHAHGYFGMNDAPVRLTFVPPTGSAQFARVIAEINLSTTPHRFNIRATNQSTSSSIGLTQNNLSTNPNGIHQIPLYLVTIPANGAITVSDQRVQLARVANAQHAQTAGTATNAGNLTGTIATAATAVTQTAGTNDTRVATTAFVTTALNNRLARSASGDGGIGSMTLPNGVIFRWGEGTAQNITFSPAFPTSCIFVGYQGHHGTLSSSTSIQSRDVGILWSEVTRTGFRWQRQSGTADITRRKWLAIGF